MASANVMWTTGGGAVCACAATAIALSAAAANALDDNIENRNEGEVQERRRDHAAGDGGADRVARFAPGAARHDERHHAEYERERGHQNGPEADARRFDRRVGDRHPARE